ncbi:MAG TPA: cation transporter [Myxococcota bacterium]|jgi:Co/Zn/Cd efflux system component
MSDACCEGSAQAASALATRHRSVLWAVLAINGGLFVVEALAGFRAGASALLGDSLDMLGDSLVYAASLYVVGRSLRAQARVAAGKGLLMGALAASVFVDAIARIASQAPPAAALVGAVGMLALAGNAVCFALLYRHRSDNLNFRSTWLCSRNDLIANVAVLASAGLVAATANRWPDALVGLALAALWLRTSLRVLGEAWLGHRGALGATCDTVPGP